jgi:hypothetical protein
LLREYDRVVGERMRSYSVTGIFHVGDDEGAWDDMTVRYGAVSSLVLEMGLRVGVSSLL